jgi:hypothetical protein
MTTARATAQKVLTVNLLEEIAIVAREPEETAMTATMMAACIAGSDFISKENFMPGADGKGVM